MRKTLILKFHSFCDQWIVIIDKDAKKEISKQKDSQEKDGGEKDQAVIGGAKESGEACREVRQCPSFDDGADFRFGYFFREGE